ncbi:TetR/AcrR family transcriptional regulator [Acetobacter senegalensis]|uniref:TetR/AcrR family transcriptional regulator n=1 Tax=Acetobacter senegalensis TaxID=446692 RepID=UPI001EDAB439|nr:TetR/AcrR family transcriptional regulator [Acetobacter senegalensis]MCG4272503.1 TetR/AcrR family transcriptional regulator [Acetobacter senegalensis]
MARPRASDYEEKRLMILERSAHLFASLGFDRASINMIAKACGTSKALFYHYYTDKQQLLFDLIETHLQELLIATDPTQWSSLTAQETLYSMTEALLNAYRDANAKHKVQLNHMDLLDPEQQDTIRMMERALVSRFSDAINAALPSPGSSPMLLKPLTMSLFAMLNWAYTWFKEDGPLSRADYARLAAGRIIGAPLP